MSKVNIFILLPEKNPSFNWINSIDVLIEENSIRDYLRNLDLYKKSINHEKYDGFYDKKSLLELVSQIKTLEDSYPQPTLRTLQILFSDFFDWREDCNNSNENNYSIFSSLITDNTFCEVAQRKHNNISQNFAFLNHQAIAIKNKIDILLNTTEKDFKILHNDSELIAYFCENRIPARNFQTIPKHNIPRPIRRRGELISPFYGDKKNAAEILKTAIGVNSKELFGYDKSKKMVIIFKYENDTPQNQFHGYHVEIESDEIPSEIRKILKKSITN
ncbi:hypothetical protein KHA90_08790 [Flavobacterium psychroterrae]|uniref:Uncharacterized protein n=1 Tax=Flavobacterium psychroterrae TaxID=2133767 RepID=A0ABS5P9Y5_9FLAO|nr:hypothetical protein [Flavobacterium psychroterrae]MBS7231120.1 hypothetical protein [Flavobacterium psychroterrae]